MAIASDGTLWGWPTKTATQNIGIPVQIGSDAEWLEVSAGGFFTLALKTDGSLWAWGKNYRSQLGDGTLIDRTAPTRIGTGVDWRQVFAAAEHSLAIKADNTLWSWGSGVSGQLGLPIFAPAAVNGKTWGPAE
jgi:trimeric autotransporter adhesin